MSVRTITRVWEHSKQSSTDLLLLLAIADHADDDGVCWPGIKRLADKTRTSERQTIRNVEKLAQSGEIFLSRQCGRGNSNLYFITTGLTQDEIAIILQSRFELDSTEANRIAEHIKKGDIRDSNYQVKKVTSSTQKVTSVTIKGDIAMSPEPSIEPSYNQTTTISAADILTNIYLLTANGKPTQTGADIINAILVEYPADIIIYACRQAELNTTPSDDKRNLSYIEAVCKRKASGQPDKPYKNGANQNGYQTQKEGSQQNRQAQAGNSPAALEYPNQQGSGLGRVSKGLGDALKARARTGGGTT